MEINKERKDKPNPKANANLFSSIFFWWLNPFLGIGAKKFLEVPDLYDVLPEDRSEYLGLKLQQEWDKELLKGENEKHGKKYKPSLVRAFIRTFGFKFYLIGVLAFLEECVIRIGQPICLGQLIHYFANDDKTIPTAHAYLYASGIVLGSGFFLIMNHPRFFICQHIGMRLRVAACSLIYKKCTILSQKALGQTTVGEVVNLMSNDVNRFDNSVTYLHYVWVGPLQTLFSTIILYYFIGSSCLIGLAVLVFFVPFQSWMGKVFSVLRHKTAKQTDNRIRAMNEIITAMRVIKMYTWEKPFAQLVSKCRKEEIEVIRRTSYFRALNMSVYFSTTAVIKILMFLLVILSGNHLTAEKVFITVSLINNTRYVMTLFFPWAITMAAEALVSIKRIENFLLLDEFKSSVRIPQQLISSEDCIVEFKQATVKWPGTDNADVNTLTDLTFHVRPGQILGIIGKVGSGKTSLLNAVLGELVPTRGTCRTVGKFAYAPQESWIYSGTVRQNILCGLDYDPKRYKKVVKACALKTDFALFPNGDLTLVGERGISLSGGQKARVNLARALYVNADIYLMDDPLSAVDTKVGRHLFKNAINGFLRNKIRILVTHQLQYLKDVDQVLVLKSGRIEAIGTYKDITSSGLEIAKTINTAEHPEQCTVESDYDCSNTLSSRCSSLKSLYQQSGSVASKPSIGDEKEIKSKAFSEEFRSSSDVPLRIYWKYFRSGFGCCSLSFFIITSTITQIFFSGSDYWLTFWTNAEENRSRNTVFISGDNQTDDSPTFSSEWWKTPNTYTGIYVFTFLVTCVFIFSFVRTVHYFIMCMHSSIHLHNRMFESIIRSPLIFFDRNPVGRVLNRFAKDIGCMDELLPTALHDVITIALSSIGILFLIGFVNPYLLLPILVLSAIILKLQHFYLKTSRDLKRLEATTRSPVFTHLSSSLIGLTTLRAHESEAIFQKVFDDYQDVHSSSWFLILATVRWFGTWLDWICVVYLACVTYACVGLRDSLTGSEAGLAISSAMAFTEMFQWGARQAADVENQMTSVERVIEYSKLPSEAPLDSTKDKKPLPTWPSDGLIQFDHMFLRYSDVEDPVLKNITCSIRTREKVGIVGRTGAGKSTLIAALFRLVEPEGTILIDGIDTKSIGLHDLRSKIAIIPQDPVLFSGSLRKNLDPFGQYSDDDLWNCLEGANLKETMKELPTGLDFNIAEGGLNFSVGQRQLICLARAILRQNRILVLDEATANVDLKTDALIQLTIRERFYNCTVLTVAHRLNTIMDSDRVMVLDSGYLKEFEEPATLLRCSDSIFYSLVEQTGPKVSAELKEMAKKAAEVRRYNRRSLVS